ncbi:MAG: aldo/keto reductase [Candidatus Hydrogenedentota bacterium]
MHYRPLGNSGFDVSVLAFGAWQMGDAGYWGNSTASDIQSTVDAALDAGINLFDTAEMYGNGESERVLGRALKGRRDSVLIATKVSPENCAPAALRASCEASLQRLGASVIDLYQVHWPPRDVPFADVCGALERLREEGKIRTIGVSNFGVRDLGNWLAAGTCVSNQLGYNLLFRAIEWDILPACFARGIGVMAYMPLMQGVLTGRWETIDKIPVQRRRTRHFASDREGTRHDETGCEQAVLDALAGIRSIAREAGESMATVALAWLIAKPGIACVVVGGRRPDQINRNLAAAELALDQSVIDELDRVTGRVKTHLGTNADLWDSGAKSRIR